MGRWGIFPNIENLGEYDPFSQIVKINKYNANDVKVDPEEKTEDFLSVFSVILHEITHWVDHSSTLWGQKNLLSLYLGLDALIREDEKEFWKIVEAGKERKKIIFSKYYSTLNYRGYDTHPERDIPWHYEYTCGLEFDLNGRVANDKPIIFTRFKNAENLIICRTPFNVQSLFEINATNSEIFLRGTTYARNNSDESLLNSIRWRRELLSRIYTPEVTA